MALQSGFFNSVNGDRKYNAEWFAKYFASFIGNGVFPNPSNTLQVIANTNMTTTVKAGKGWINGYFVINDSDYILQHDIADGVLKRIDRIVMRLNYLTRQIEIAVKKGTYSSTPTAPALQRDTDAYELALADVLINNGATQITQANITDQRLNNAVCGIVHGIVNQVDTTTLFNQYQSWINQQKSVYETELAIWTAEQIAEFEQWQSLTEQDFATWKSDFETVASDWFAQEQQDFETWFASLQVLLDENVAATLTAKVQAIETGKADSADLTQLQEQVTSHLDESNPNAHQISNITGLTSALNNISIDTSSLQANIIDLAIELEITKAAELNGVDSNIFIETFQNLDDLTLLNGAYNSVSKRIEV